MNFKVLALAFNVIIGEIMNILQQIRILLLSVASCTKKQGLTEWTE